MNKVVLYVSMSVDGLITGPDTEGIADSAHGQSGCTTGCAPAMSRRHRTGLSL
jgi:hypothetical protein